MALRRHEIYAKIKEDIVMGSYGIGEQLSVDDLAAKYAVSKTPVKEALNLLQAEGLVEIVPRVGYFTAPLTLKQLQDMFELRLILEGNAVRLAAIRITPDELSRLKEMHGSYVMGDVNTYLPWLRYNREFHHGIALASHNDDLAEMVGNILDRLQRVHWHVLDLIPFPPADIESHERVLVALQEGDSDAAEEALTRHINASRDAALRKILERPGEWTL